MATSFRRPRSTIEAVETRLTLIDRSDMEVLHACVARHSVRIGAVLSHRVSGFSGEPEGSTWLGLELSVSFVVGGIDLMTSSLAVLIGWNRTTSSLSRLRACQEETDRLYSNNYWFGSQEMPNSRCMSVQMAASDVQRRCRWVEDIRALADVWLLNLDSDCQVEAASDAYTSLASWHVTRGEAEQLSESLEAFHLDMNAFDRAHGCETKSKGVGVTPCLPERCLVGSR
jgi:hypothetical protein